MRFRIKLLIIGILLMAFSAPSMARSAQFQPPVIFKLTLNYDGDSILNATFDIVEGYSEEEYVHFGELFTAKIIGANNRVLYTTNFSMSTQVFDGDFYNQTEFALRLPFYNKAEFINIYKGDALVYSLRIKLFMEMNDNISQDKFAYDRFYLFIALAALICLILLLYIFFIRKRSV